jgi:diguanylate cyclase (GGDEF)-like protein/PAS domain S-box-containing protein
MRSLSRAIQGWITAAPLARVRLLCLALAVADAGAIVVGNLGTDRSSWLRICGTLLPVALSAYWAWGHRRGAFPLAGEPLEALALFAILHASPGSPFLPLFGLVFRSLYGGTPMAFVRYALWAAALLGAHGGRDAETFDADVSRVVGLAVIPALMPALRAALEGVAASERRLRSLVHNSTDIIMVVDDALMIGWQSDAMRAVLGHAPPALRGTPVLDLVCPDDRAALTGYVDRARAHPGLTETLPLRVRHGDGTLRDVDAAVADHRADPSVAGFVLNLRDETARRRLEGELRELAARLEREALYDSLTGLPNRRMLFTRLAAAVDEADAVVMLIDLDHFKELNDTLGHQAGDDLLREIGPRLRSALGPDDLVARLGGDEFAVVLASGAGTAAAEAVAVRLQTAIQEPFVYQGMSLLVRASIGIAAAPEHAQDVETLMQRADVAMYLAKDRGAGHEVYATARDGHSKERLSLIGELPGAIANGAIMVHYQPQLDLATAAITGAEALVRWDHPEHGLLGPGAFLALAEHAGLMRGLTLSVLDQALAQCARWSAEGLTVDVAVNLSAPDLLDHTLGAEVAAALARWGVDPARLRLEITETIIGADPERVTETMGSLRALGVMLSLDDFGTGSSSLGYLRRLPVQELKLDKSFIMGLADDERDVAFVRTIIALAHDLGLRTVGEGIETLDACERLLALGCDQGQGFLLGRPMPAAELTVLLRERRQPRVHASGAARP